MTEQLEIYRSPPLQRRQIIAVAARSVVINLLVLTVWIFFCGLVFISSSLFLAIIVAKFTFIQTMALSAALILVYPITTGFIGYYSAALGQGPGGHLRHRKIRTFTASSILSLLPVCAFCGYLVFTNMLDNNNRYIAFFSFMVMMALPIYVLGQCLAVLISARKLRAAAQIERAKHTA